MKNSMRTMVLKLYKPSNVKKEIIEEAMKNYTLAFQYLLDRAKIDMEDIKIKYLDSSGKYNSRSMTKWIDNNLSTALNQFNIEPFKDSLKLDFAASICGYLNSIKRGQLLQYPEVYVSEEDFQQEYNNCMDSLLNYDGEEDFYTNKINKLLAKRENMRPIFFCRYSTNRNFCLLYDALKNKYYAKIYLMNGVSDKRRNFTKNTNKIIRYIDKEKEPFKVYNKKQGFLIFPLAFGQWQEQYLRMALEKPEIIKTARLSKRGKEYYLSINFNIQIPEKKRTTTYMSICRGIENIINYTIVDENEVVREYGVEQINNNHVLASTLTKIAAENNCQVVMEKLVDRGDRLNWVEDGEVKNNVQLDCNNYNRLYEIIKYKLPERGLPPPIRVSSVSIFYTCPRCGHTSKLNRFNEKILICTLCGMSMHVEQAGSINLARKIIKYSKDKINIVCEKVPEGFKYSNNDLGLNLVVKDGYDCNIIITNEMKRIVSTFLNNMGQERSKEGFKKKYSLIKKIESNSDILKYIKIINI